MKYITAEDAQPQGAPTPLTPAQVEHWRSAGFVALRGLWPQGLISECHEDAHATWEEGWGTKGNQRTGGGDDMEFPSAGSSAVNQIALHERFSAPPAPHLPIGSLLSPALTPGRQARPRRS